MNTENNYFFEGTLVAAGWDKSECVNQASLYTQEDEDILLNHRFGMKTLKNYLNKRVRIWGNVIRDNNEGRRVNVKKIVNLIGDFSEPSSSPYNEYGDLVLPAA